VGLKAQIKADFQHIYSDSTELAITATYTTGAGQTLAVNGVLDAPIFGDINNSPIITDKMFLYVQLDFEPSKDDYITIDDKEYGIESISVTLAGYRLKLTDKTPSYSHTKGRFR